MNTRDADEEEVGWKSPRGSFPGYLDPRLAEQTLRVSASVYPTGRASVCVPVTG